MDKTKIKETAVGVILGGIVLGFFLYLFLTLIAVKDQSQTSFNYLNNVVAPLIQQKK